MSPYPQSRHPPLESATTALRVRRAKAALSSGCKSDISLSIWRDPPKIRQRQALHQAAPKGRRLGRNLSRFDPRHSLPLTWIRCPGPSRAAMMTRRYSTREGLSPVIIPCTENTLSARAYTMGDMFHEHDELRPDEPSVASPRLPRNGPLLPMSGVALVWRRGGSSGASISRIWP